MFVLDEGCCLLGTAQKDVHYLLRIDGIKGKSEDVLYDEFVHVVESTCSMESFIFRSMMTSPVFIPPLCRCHSGISGTRNGELRVTVDFMEGLCNVFRGPFLPLLVNVFRIKQLSVKLSATGTHSDHLFQEIFFVGFVVFCVFFHNGCKYR